MHTTVCPQMPVNPMAARMVGCWSRQGVESGGCCAPLDGTCYSPPKTATEGLNARTARTLFVVLEEMDQMTDQRCLLDVYGHLRELPAKGDDLELIIRAALNQKWQLLEV